MRVRDNREKTQTSFGKLHTISQWAWRKTPTTKCLVSNSDYFAHIVPIQPSFFIRKIFLHSCDECALFWFFFLFCSVFFRQVQRYELIFFIYLFRDFFFFLLPKWVFLVRTHNPPVGRGRPLTFRFRQPRRTHMSSRPLDRIINVRHGEIYGWTNKFNARFVVVVREKPRTLHVKRTGTLFLTPPRPHRRVHSKRFLRYIVRHTTHSGVGPLSFSFQNEKKKQTIHGKY